MNYFIGSLYGNYEGYLYIKEQLHLKKNDTLWILGDVLDGNDANPEQVVKMIQDIQNSPNINLLLGDHEFAHIMRYISTNNKESYESWKNYIANMDISGEAMVWYFENVMDEYDLDSLFAYLINDCEISQLIQIGDNYFYLTHGFPVEFNGNLTEWQLRTTSSELQKGDYIRKIKTDPSFPKEMLNELNKTNCFVISGHQNIRTIPNANAIYHQSGIFLLGEDIPNEQIPVLGIDAAGYFFNNIVYNND